MKPIQWLLIGGEGHGQTLWIKGGTSVRYPCKGSLSHLLYEGKDYLSEGKLFRIGMCQETSEQVAQIPSLIVGKQLNALDAA